MIFGIIKPYPSPLVTGRGIDLDFAMLAGCLALLGLGLMLSAGEVPRICGAFGLDTSTRANIMSAVYAAQSAVNTTRTVVQAVGAAK